MIDSFTFTYDIGRCFCFILYSSINRTLHVLHVLYEYVSSAASSVQEPNAMQRRDVTYIYQNQERESKFQHVGQTVLA